MAINNGYLFFWGGILSNFHMCRIHYDNHTFSSSEQVFMYLKAKEFGDIDIMNKILVALTPKEAKKLGREVKNFDSDKWDKRKEYCMLEALQAKFDSCTEFRKELIASGNLTLVEASPYDRIWGIGYSEEDALLNVSNWGENLLGLCLTRIRNINREKS